MMKMIKMKHADLEEKKIKQESRNIVDEFVIYM